MTYPEEAIAAAIRDAIESGAITRCSAVEVFSDSTAEAEWDGTNKIYVLRGELTLIGDITAGGDSGFGSSEVTVTVLGSNKAESAALFDEVETALLAALESGIEGVASWRVTGKDAFARFAEGSFHDEYYHTIKLNVYHLTK